MPDAEASVFKTLDEHTSHLDAAIQATQQKEDTINQLLRATKPSQKRAAQQAIAAAVALGLSGEDEETLKAQIHEKRKEIKKLITGVLQVILHDSAFKKLERPWAELSFLKQRLPSDGDSVRVRVLNAGKRDLVSDFNQAGSGADSFRKSVLYRKVYRGALGKSGEDPNTLLISGIPFGNDDKDLHLLTNIGRVAKAAHSPWIAPAGPDFFECQTFLDFDLDQNWTKEFQMGRAEWNSFREKEESRFVGLAMPGVLLRKPYKDEPISDRYQGFLFTEEIAQNGEDNLWGGAAHVMAAAVGGSYAEYGWPAKICGRYHGGAVKDVPLVDDPKKPGKQTCVPVELDNEMELTLSRLGFLPFERWAKEGTVAFAIPASAHKAEAGNESDELSSRFPHLLVGCRFAHYLKVILRNGIGAQKNADEIEADLTDWLNRFRIDVAKPTQRQKARYPLETFKVNVERTGAGHYSASIVLKPWYILESIDVNIELFGELDLQEK